MVGKRKNMAKLNYAIPKLLPISRGRSLLTVRKDSPSGSRLLKGIIKSSSIGRLTLCFPRQQVNMCHIDMEGISGSSLIRASADWGLDWVEGAGRERGRCEDVQVKGAQGFQVGGEGKRNVIFPGSAAAFQVWHRQQATFLPLFRAAKALLPFERSPSFMISHWWSVFVFHPVCSSTRMAQ